MAKKIKELQQAGITLIALVVTIIVLLVLAGVTLNLVLGQNGVIIKAQTAYSTQARATIQEEIEQARGYAETYRQTRTGDFWEKMTEQLENSDTLKRVGVPVEVTNGSEGGENFLILSVAELHYCKITESEIIWLDNAEEAEEAENAVRPEIVNLQSGDIEFSFSPSTPTQGDVTVTITEKEGLDKKGNTLSYKIGSASTWTPYTEPFTVSDNCVITAGLYNGKDVGSTASGNVSNIDRTAPTSCTFTIDETTADSITVTATASDATGIKYFDFSSDGGSTYPTANRKTITTPVSGSANETFTFTGLSAGTSYTLKVKATDGAGNSLQSNTQTQPTKDNTAPIGPVPQIGDVVNYNANSNGKYTYTINTADTTANDYTGDNIVSTFSSADNMTWKIMDIDEDTGEIKLMSANDTPSSLQLYGRAGYAYCENILNNISEVYGHGTGATGARSVTVEDINKLTEYDPVAQGKGMYTQSYTSGDYFVDLTYENGKVKSYATKTATSSSPYMQTGDKYYNYAGSTYLSNITNTYKMIFQNTRGRDRQYYLASRCVYFDSSVCGFGVRSVYSGGVYSNSLCYSNNGGETGLGWSVCPVVSLNSNIQLTWDSTISRWNIS